MAIEPIKRIDHESPVHIDIGRFLRLVLPTVSARTLFHVPNGGKRPGKTGALLKGMGVRSGAADWLFVHIGILHCIEVKVDADPLRGISKTYQSGVQKDFERDIVAAGALYAVCRSVDDVRGLLAHWGIQTRETARARPMVGAWL